MEDQLEKCKYGGILLRHSQSSYQRGKMKRAHENRNHHSRMLCCCSFCFALLTEIGLPQYSSVIRTLNPEEPKFAIDQTTGFIQRNPQFKGEYSYEWELILKAN